MGVELPSKRVVMEWIRDPQSISLFDSIYEVEQTHGHGGSTKLCLGLPSDISGALK